MHFFRYAQDYYGDWLAVQLLPDAARLLIWLVAVFIGVHLLRRSFDAPVASTHPDAVIGSGVQKYTLGARLYHWGNFLLITLLAASGWALFIPRSLKSPFSSWILIHEVSSGLFVAGLLLHIAAALTRGERRSMWFARGDWKDARLIAANFLGKNRSYPRFGKYDPFQKLYHAFLTILSAAMIFSGVSLVFSAEDWSSFDHPWLRWQRLLHDVGAFIFISIILGHIYFGIIKVNWPELAAMFTGRISRSQFRLKHSATKWKPKDEAIEAAAEAERKTQ